MYLFFIASGSSVVMQRMIIRLVVQSFKLKPPIQLAHGVFDENADQGGQSGTTKRH